MTLFILLGFVTDLLAQPQQKVNYKQVINKLERGVQKGNKRALRDLISLVEKDGIKIKVRDILNHNTLFTNNQINVNNSSKDQLLSFFYTNHQQLKYSELFGAFYITDPEARTYNYSPPVSAKENIDNRSVVLQKLIANYTKSFENKSVQETQQTIQLIAKIKTTESYQFLYQQLQFGAIEKQFKKEAASIYISLIQAIESAPDYKSFLRILELIKTNKLTWFQVEDSLAKITNILAPSHLESSQRIHYYENLIDSLHTLSAVRKHGYDQLFNYKISFFYDEVDFYGKVLCQSNNLSWVTHNAYIDLVKTKHPRILMYLASFIYKNRSKIQTSEVFDAVNRLEELTYIPVPKDMAQLDDFMFYWWQSYDDYEWNEKQFHFVNKAERLDRLAKYEKHFRRLNSKNDTVAIASYRLLTEGRPDEIIELTRQYRGLLRTINKQLPTLKIHYLERLVELTSFCKENKIDYNLNEHLRLLLNQLAATKAPQHITALESEIIEELEMDDLTGLEYYTILNTVDRDLNLSVGRILDIFYSKHWNTVVNDPSALRLYLKKAQLFSNIGASGICNDYLYKFDIDNPILQEKLDYLLSIETDKGIKNQIAQLATKEQMNTTTSLISVSDFIEYPMQYNKVELQVLPGPNEKQQTALLEKIKTVEDPKLVLQYFKYLSYQCSFDEVPFLFKLMEIDRIIIHNKDKTVTVADRVVPILEDIYNYTFSDTDYTLTTEEWKKLWQDNQAHFKDWSRLFWKEKLETLQAKEELTIKELNNFVEMVDDDAYFIKASLELTAKVRPLKNIRRLKVARPLNPTDELNYFKGLGLTYKYLDDIPKLFDIQHPEKMVQFLEEESKDFDKLDKGLFFNNLFESKWFLDYVLSGKLSSESIESYTDLLEFYINESDFLSEYEEERTLENITHLKNIGQPIADKLEAVLALDVDNKIKTKIQQAIIARVAYDDISTIIDFLPYMNSTPNNPAFAFLSTDFGIPFYEMDSTQIKLIKERHQSLSEFEFYKSYLLDFGLDFLTKKQDLDFNKIYTILKFDVVSPLTGNGGSKRDFYVYGVIKLLELHFETRLGFHEKLNESQTFYTFTSSKRAKAWRKYLKEKNLVDTSKYPAPSFNRNPLELQ